MLTLADVIEASTGTRPEGASQVISEASIDSRKIIPASLFVALPGEHADGHDFVGEAFQRGAHFALVQRDLSGQFPTLDVRKGDDWLEKVKSLKTPCCILVPDSLKALQDTARLWRRKLKVKVIGITGSVGKSTSKETIAGVLSQRYHP